MAKSGKLVRVERGIFKRHGRFVVLAYTGKKNTYLGAVDSLQEARDLQAKGRTETKTRIAQGKAPKPDDKQTFAAYAKDWLSRKLPTMKSSTYRSTDAVVGQALGSTFGLLPLRSLTTTVIEDGFSTMRRKNGAPFSPKSLRNIAQLLREILKDAVYRDALSAVPPFRLPITRDAAAPKRVTIHDPSVILSALTAMPSPYREAATLAAVSGLRQGEVLALRWEDIGATCIHVRASRDQSGVSTTTKSYAGIRDVPAEPDVLAFLERYRKTAPPSDYLFPASKGGAFKGKRNPDRLPVIDDSALRKQFKAACVKVGITARFHDLRHVFASQVLAEGGHSSLQLLKTILGHTDASFTLRQYGHLLPSQGTDLLAGVARAYSSLLGTAESHTSAKTSQSHTKKRRNISRLDASDGVST